MRNASPVGSRLGCARNTGGEKSTRELQRVDVSTIFRVMPQTRMGAGSGRDRFTPMAMERRAFQSMEPGSLTGHFSSNIEASLRSALIWITCATCVHVCVPTTLILSTDPPTFAVDTTVEFCAKAGFTTLAILTTSRLSNTAGLARSAGESHIERLDSAIVIALTRKPRQEGPLTERSLRSGFPRHNGNPQPRRPAHSRRPGTASAPHPPGTVPRALGSGRSLRRARLGPSHRSC
jgi:hypothetical protein